MYNDFGAAASSIIILIRMTLSETLMKTLHSAKCHDSSGCHFAVCCGAMVYADDEGVRELDNQWKACHDKQDKDT